MNIPYGRKGLVLAALLLAACGGPTEFSAPLGPPAPAAVQERLVGTWASIDACRPKHDNCASLFLHVGPTGGDRLAGKLIYSAMFNEHEPVGAETRQLPVLVWRGTGYLTEFEDAQYVVFRRQDEFGDTYTPRGVKPGYSLFKIRFEGADRLRLQHLRDDAIKKFEETGRIAVQMRTGSNQINHSIDYQYVTVDTATLQELVRTAVESGRGDDEIDFLFQRLVPLTPASETKETGR